METYGLGGSEWERPKPVDDKVRAAAAKIVGKAHYLDSVPDRITYARDCWPLGILWTRAGKVFRFSPDFVVIPGSVDELVELVNLARQSKTPIVPFGAGSGVCGGTLPVHGGFIVDMKRFDGIHHLDEERMTVRAGAGSIGMHLETDLNRRGLTMGHYPSSLICSSLGGYLAGRSAGQLSSRFGKIEDMCLSQEIVMGTGEVVETARWRPDLTQLVIGSEGTLGLITEATMRVEPLGEERLYRGFKFHSIEAALLAIRQVIQKGFRPTVVRLYDEFDSLIAGRSSHKEADGAEEDVEPTGLMSQLAQFASDRAVTPLRGGIETIAKAMIKRAIGKPVWLNRLCEALPMDCLMIIGFEGPAPLTTHEANAAFDVLRRDGSDLGAGPGEHWYDNRFAVSYKQSPMMDLGVFVDTMEVSTTWDNIHNLYRSVRRAVRANAFIMAHFSHVYPEGSSIYFTFAGIAPDGEPIEALYNRTWETALNAVRRSGASIAHHHGAGLSKARFIGCDHEGGRPLNDLLKERFDPDRIMNPGKLWDARQVTPPTERD